jgi:hypothetical protein
VKYLSYFLLAVTVIGGADLLYNFGNGVRNPDWRITLVEGALFCAILLFALARIQEQLQCIIRRLDESARSPSSS